MLFRYNFPIEEWSSISEEAKDLIDNLLVRDASCRLSATRILNHPWLKVADKVVVRDSALRTSDNIKKNQSAKDISKKAESVMEVNRVIMQHFSMNYSYIERPNIYHRKCEVLRATQSYCPSKKRSTGPLLIKSSKNVPKDVNSIYQVELHSENIKSEDLEFRIKANAALNNERCKIKSSRKEGSDESQVADGENGECSIATESAVEGDVNNKLDQLELSGGKKVIIDDWGEEPVIKEDTWRGDECVPEETYAPIGLSPPNESHLMQRRLKPLSSVDNIIVGVYSN